MPAIYLVACGLLIVLLCLWTWRCLNCRRKPTLTKIKGITISDTILNPSLKTDLLAFGTFTNPASTRILLPSEYTVLVTDPTGTEVVLTQGPTTLDHSVNVSGTPEDVPIGTEVWQTPVESNGVALTAKFTATGPNGSVIEDDETYTFTGGQPVLVGLVGAAVQE